MKTNIRIVILLLAVGCAFTPAVGQTIRIRGSESLVPISQAWADAYSAKHAAGKFEVGGGGAGAAFAALAERKIDLALVSRSMRYKETQPCETAFGQRPVELKVGVSGVAVYVNPANPIKVITYEELSGIFRGNYQSWKQLGGEDAPILAYAQETNSAPGELFIEEVLNGKSLGGEVRLLPGPAVRKTVAQAKNAIGFAAFATAEGIRAVAIKRVFSSTPAEPTEDAIANRIFPISRFLYAYLDPAAQKGELAAYLEWIRSEEGQEIARRAGFYALPAKWRARP